MPLKCPIEAEEDDSESSSEISLLLNNLIYFVHFDTNRIYFLNFIVFIIDNFNSVTRTTSTEKISHASLSCVSTFSTHLSTSGPFRAIQLLAHRFTFPRPISGAVLKAAAWRETKEPPINIILTYQAKLRSAKSKMARKGTTWLPQKDWVRDRRVMAERMWGIKVWCNTWYRRIITRSRNLGILLKYHTNLWR